MHVVESYLGLGEVCPNMLSFETLNDGFHAFVVKGSLFYLSTLSPLSSFPALFFEFCMP